MIKFTVTVEKENGNNALVAIEPLEQGYGHTLGNSLRRCMLSSLPGSAITSIKIAGVSHQFSTIKGVTEDVIQIILNLKKLRVKLYNEKSIRLTIQKSGEGAVTGADIDALGQGEIVNPELHIATITDPKIKLSIEMVAETGTGYMPAEEKKGGELSSLSVDAIFSPVVSVNYTVDSTRVGRSSNFDKLNLDITTDGTITPVDAVYKAAEILTGYFKQVYEPTAQEEVVEVKTASNVSDDLLRTSVEELDLPVRITNALKAIEIDTIGKLVAFPKHQLMKAKNLGTKSLGLISEKLAERGLFLGEA